MDVLLGYKLVVACGTQLLIRWHSQNRVPVSCCLLITWLTGYLFPAAYWFTWLTGYTCFLLLIDHMTNTRCLLDKRDHMVQLRWRRRQEGNLLKTGFSKMILPQMKGILYLVCMWKGACKNVHVYLFQTFDVSRLWWILLWILVSI